MGILFKYVDRRVFDGPDVHAKVCLDRSSNATLSSHFNSSLYRKIAVELSPLPARDDASARSLPQRKEVKKPSMNQ